MPLSLSGTAKLWVWMTVVDKLSLLLGTVLAVGFLAFCSARYISPILLSHHKTLLSNTHQVALCSVLKILDTRLKVKAPFPLLKTHFYFIPDVLHDLYWKPFFISYWKFCFTLMPPSLLNLYWKQPSFFFSLTENPPLLYTHSPLSSWSKKQTCLNKKSWYTEYTVHWIQAATTPQ